MLHDLIQTEGYKKRADLIAEQREGKK